MKLKYFYLAAFIYTAFTVNLTFLLLCLNSLSIDTKHNSTSDFSQVGKTVWCINVEGLEMLCTYKSTIIISTMS